MDMKTDRFKKFLIQNFHATIPNITNSNSKRFFILMHGISGSSLLVYLLNNHSKIKCSGEIFYDVNKNPFDLILGLEKYYRWRKGQGIVWGFKAKVEQIRKCGITPELFLDKLHKRNTTIISLIKKNIFRLAISVLLAGKRGGRYHNNDKKNKQFSPIYINPIQVIAVMKQRQKQNKDIESIVNNLSVACLSLNYEEHLSNATRQKVTCQAIFDQFQIDKQPISSSFKKMTTNKLFDSVSNAKEVIRVVSNSEFAEYVADISI